MEYSTEEFPDYEEAKMSEPEEIFGLHFPTGRVLKFESEKDMITLCENYESLNVWLNVISQKTYLYHGYNKVIIQCLVKVM